MIARLATLVRANQKELIRFLKFSAVGTLGAVIDFGLLNLLVQLAGFPEDIAKACSFTAAVISNFVWNRLWVYPETRGEPLRKQFVQFAVVNVAGLIINMTIFKVSFWLLGEGGLLAGPAGGLALAIGMSHFVLALNGANAIATGVVLFWNFIVNRFWTFRHIR
ncbi:MAG: GtrA family protein [Anaerolineae bacterium]|nr:GtrA family protein [Anaerolineae bacterium]